MSGGRRPALDDAQKRKAYDIYTTGANDEVIAIKLGCSSDQVKRWRAATGLPEGGTSAPKPETPEAKSGPVVVIQPAVKEAEKKEPEKLPAHRKATSLEIAAQLVMEHKLSEIIAITKMLQAFIEEVGANA